MKVRVIATNGTSRYLAEPLGGSVGPAHMGWVINNPGADNSIAADGPIDYALKQYWDLLPESDRFEVDLPETVKECVGSRPGQRGLGERRQR
jgi:hypothetical protein